MEAAATVTAVEVVNHDEEKAITTISKKEKQFCTRTRMLIAGGLVVVVTVILAVSLSGKSSSENESSVPGATNTESSPEDAADTSNLTFGTGTALVMLDFQDCFMESIVSSTGETGSLVVGDTSSLIPVMNEIRQERDCLFDIVVRSNDSHPSKHISFGSTHGLPPFAHMPIEMGGLGKGELPVSCLSSATNPSCCPTYWINQGQSDCAKPTSSVSFRFVSFFEESRK